MGTFLRYLLVSILFLEVASTVRSSCAYMNGIAPPAGSCAGPMERVIAKRRAIATLNRGCALNQVFFVNESMALKCGACVPGTHGNWRFLGVPQQFDIPVQSSGLVRPQNTATSPRSFCGPNEFCTDEGLCRHLRTSPLYHADCSVFPFATDRLEEDVCGPGLQCVHNCCVICDEHADEKRPTGTMPPAYCVKGEYTFDDRSEFAMEPRPVFVIVMCSLAGLWGLGQVVDLVLILIQQHRAAAAAAVAARTHTHTEDTNIRLHEDSEGRRRVRGER